MKMFWKIGKPTAADQIEGFYMFILVLFTIVSILGIISGFVNKNASPVFVGLSWFWIIIGWIFLKIFFEFIYATVKNSAYLKNISEK